MKYLIFLQPATFHFAAAVNFLAEVGVDPGPNGVNPGAPLTDNATSPDWQQISSDFPIGFAVYTQAVLDGYSGSIASLNDGGLSVAVESFGASQSSALQILTVTLPGQIPLRAAIPNSDKPNALQSIGVSVQSKLLSVVVNCTLINSVWLANMPTSLNIETVEVFNPPTTVSQAAWG